MILTEEEILQSWYSNTELMPSDGMIQQRVFARTIEQAILNKLQDKLKNADRYEWLRDQFWVEEEATFRLGLGITENSFEYHEDLDKAIDSAMKGNKL